MKIRDVEVGKDYAWGESRQRVTVLEVGILLPYYTFRGVRIRTHRKEPYEKSIPARELVCSWEEQETLDREEERGRRDRHEAIMKGNEVARSITEILGLFGIECRARCYFLTSRKEPEITVSFGWAAAGSFVAWLEELEHE